jgi:hypothetical protein
MRTTVPAKLEKGRLRQGRYRSLPEDGLMGAFVIMGPAATRLKILSSGVDSEYGWEHVSVSTVRRPPIWAEMCFVKDLFWDDDECVVEYHPVKAEYVNCHPHCLHLWKPIGLLLPTPPMHLVG